MATRFKNDEHMRAHIERAMQKLPTSLRYSTPSIQRMLQEEGYIASIDRVFRIVHEIQNEEADDEVLCHWCGKYTDRATADLVGVDAGTSEDMYWCGCEEGEGHGSAEGQ